MEDVVENEGGIWVKLTLTEMLHGCSVGAVRHHEAIAAGRKDKHGFDPSEKSGLGMHIDGACGEIAVCKAIDRFFSGGVNTFKEADIGKSIQVRTRSSHKYDLIVRKDDAPDHIYILVTGSAPVFCVRGWVLGSDAMNHDFIADHAEREAAYFVPKSALKKMQRSI